MRHLVFVGSFSTLVLAACAAIVGLEEPRGVAGSPDVDVAPPDVGPPPTPNDGGVTDVQTPPDPDRLPVALGVGGFHACVARKSGSVWCWGSNAALQSGQATSSTQEPKEVPGLQDVVEVAAGKLHTCARKKDKSVWCWGDNSTGQLGHSGGDSTCRGVPCNGAPVQVQGLVADAVAAGNATTCAVSGGKVLCWGLNASGLLGKSTNPDAGGLAGSTSPVMVAGIEGARSIHLGLQTNQACAVTPAATVLCWGDNALGALGRPAGDVSCSGNACPMPKGVGNPALTNVGAVAIGEHSACAAGAGGGSVRCWGLNTFGLLGRAPFDGGDVQYEPVAAPELASLTALIPYNGYRTFCGTNRTEVHCWGEQTYGASAKAADGPSCAPSVPCSATPTLVPGVTDVLAVGGGVHWGAALTKTGEVFAWGINDSNQLGHPKGTAGDSTCDGDESPFACNPVPSVVSGLK